MFVADGLSALLHREASQDSITPMKVCRRAPGISHLLFADDTLLFFKADNEQAERVKHVLEIYAKGTGQVINPNKCSILFSPICPTSTRDSIKGTLKITQATFEAK